MHIIYTYNYILINCIYIIINYVLINIYKTSHQSVTISKNQINLTLADPNSATDNMTLRM
jgi:hypothetical protein